MQGALFTDDETPASVPEWRRVPGVLGGGSCGATFIHRDGAVVQHCGHPTALRPYYVVGRLEELGAIRALADAKAAALTPVQAPPPGTHRAGDYVAIKFPAKAGCEGYTRTGVFLAYAGQHLRVVPNGGKPILITPDRIECNLGQDHGTSLTAQRNREHAAKTVATYQGTNP